MLFIQISQQRYAISVEQIRHIGYVDACTPLPFIGSPIEGIINFNHQPVLLVNLAAALGMPSQGRKCLVIGSALGEVALRVDEIFDIDHSNAANLTQTTGKACHKVLRIEELLPWTQRKRVNLLKADLVGFVKPNAAVPLRPVLYALAVKSGSLNVALTTENIEHIQELLSVKPTKNTGNTFIKIKGELIATHSLQTLAGSSSETLINEAVALILDSSQGKWALLVEEVFGLQAVNCVYATNAKTGVLDSFHDSLHIEHLLTTQPHSRFWYISALGVQELTSAERLLAGQLLQPLTVSIIDPKTEQTSLPLPRSSNPNNEGLQVDCGSNSYLFPLALVKRTINGLDVSLKSQRRFVNESQRQQPITRLPLLNGIMLLSGRISLCKTRYILLLALPRKGQILIAVNQAFLCLPTNSWLSLALPQPAALFFDAASYDANQDCWVLRINSAFDFGFLPYRLKKAIVRSIVGWFDSHVIDNLL